MHDGNLIVSPTFIYPEGCENWPEYFRRIKSGSRVGDIVLYIVLYCSVYFMYLQFHDEFHKLGLASGKISNLLLSQLLVFPLHYQ